MSNELRYSELKYNGQIYTEQWKIDEILIQNKFNWMVNAEIKNARLEIFQDTLVFNAGIWYNGDWYFGVWRDGEWRYGNWQNGVWYNGVWRDGTFKSGIIYNGKFFKGKIVTGEIRGGQFIDIEIAPEVTEFTGDEYQVRQGEVQKSQTATANTTVQPQTDQVRVHSTQPANLQPVAQPSIQQEKKEYKNMKKIKMYEEFQAALGDGVGKEGLPTKNVNIKNLMLDITKLSATYNPPIKTQYHAIASDILNKKCELGMSYNMFNQFVNVYVSKEDQDILTDITTHYKGKYKISKIYIEQNVPFIRIGEIDNTSQLLN